jgi:3-deoxy-7-phosphoheptulonate synthase
MEEIRLKLLASAKEGSGLPSATEVINPREIILLERFADVIQVVA